MSCFDALVQILPREEVSCQFVDINVVHVNVERRRRIRRKLFVDVVDDFFHRVDRAVVAVNDGRQVSKAVQLELVRKSTRGDSRDPKFETS